MTPDEQQFVERVGRYFEADGFPRIAGRLYGFLLLQDAPRSLGELAETLSVSKASVSTNARLLEQWALAERLTRPGDRRDYYGVPPDPTRTLQLRLERVRGLGRLLREGLVAVPEERVEVRGRLERMTRFNGQALRRLESLLADWRTEAAPGE